MDWIIAAVEMEGGFELVGWVEVDGRRLSGLEVFDLVREGPQIVSRFGGEFFLSWDGFSARDRFGIVPGDCPPGSVVCDGQVVGVVDPDPPASDLAAAIETAVLLRSQGAVVALSGGVDSALVAAIARRECVVAGVEGSGDLRRAREVADLLNLPLAEAVIDPGRIEEALAEVIAVIPRVTPVDGSIAATLYFVAEWAGDHGYVTILAGQGADELFGGYARYLEAERLEEEMDRDILGLPAQAARDQAVAGLFGVRFSLPYLDLRVVRAARGIPPEEKVAGGVRKRPLRKVAALYLPGEVAHREKKAMQYGSGVMREMKRLARRRGFSSVSDYMDTFR
ncbi:asparagine synthase-related protein [Candidatus Methanocrinis natronophilus]|uniref:Asparagine synthase-related protein n=1 Tax=Candidatus Methanocrinis natronophilus TaxID=3033396 RepID=A0ABT5X5B9_9EURY|nr:asparagine synthase-related protein [Candidatus Methanocrinis natronophilus]MDF0589892.1 asparagine synthase-related protein [Candidatus Methanocrinis natronophilus]